MHIFRTLLPSLQLPVRISHQSRILSIGSCFAEQIGNRLARLKFPHLLNPFGIVYHPIVLAMQLDELSGKTSQIDLHHVFERQELWRHYAFHSRFARSSPEELVSLLHHQFTLGQTFLQDTDVLILTLGTAYGYRLVSSQEWVNNCHKQPANTFTKERATVASITQALSESLSYIHAARPQLQVLLTVSPVRHLRDGLTDNQRSKATLLLACEALSTEHDFIHYFPAYEYLLDDLRDYRFYGPDMLHPNPVAVDYIWQHFTMACWDESTKTLASQIEKLVQAAEHRPLHSSSEAFQTFQQRQCKAILKFQDSHPNFDFSRELKLLGYNDN